MRWYWRQSTEEQVKTIQLWWLLWTLDCRRKEAVAVIVGRGELLRVGCFQERAVKCYKIAYSEFSQIFKHVPLVVRREFLCEAGVRLARN
jgi:hypothetical protein